MSMPQSLRTLYLATRPARLWNTRRFTTMADPASPAEGSGGPVEKTIREKVTSSLAPTRLEIHNDSHLHRHHAAMADSTSAETHFRLVVASDRFRGLAQIRRHRMVNDLLREDLARQGGIHALQLRTMTPEEDEKRRAQEQEQEQEQEQGQQQQQKEEQKEQQG